MKWLTKQKKLTRIDALSKNPIPILSLKISEKTKHKEPPPRHKSPRKRFQKDGADRGSEETQPDTNT